MTENTPEQSPSVEASTKEETTPGTQETPAEVTETVTTPEDHSPETVFGKPEEERAGLREKDYTNKMQKLAEERKAFEEQRASSVTSPESDEYTDPALKNLSSKVDKVFSMLEEDRTERSVATERQEKLDQIDSEVRQVVGRHSMFKYDDIVQTMDKEGILEPGRALLAAKIRYGPELARLDTEQKLKARDAGARVPMKSGGASAGIGSTAAEVPGVNDPGDVSNTSWQDLAEQAAADKSVG